jgi:hypothetical protein
MKEVSEVENMWIVGRREKLSHQKVKPRRKHFVGIN